MTAGNSTPVTNPRMRPASASAAASSASSNRPDWKGKTPERSTGWQLRSMRTRSSRHSMHSRVTSQATYGPRSWTAAISSFETSTSGRPSADNKKDREKNRGQWRPHRLPLLAGGADTRTKGPGEDRRPHHAVREKQRMLRLYARSTQPLRVGPGNAREHVDVYPLRLEVRPELGSRLVVAL